MWKVVAIENCDPVDVYIHKLQALGNAVVNTHTFR